MAVVDRVCAHRWNDHSLRTDLRLVSLWRRIPEPDELYSDLVCCLFLVLSGHMADHMENFHQKEKGVK